MPDDTFFDSPEPGVTAHWLNSREVLRFAGNDSDTLELSVDETQKFWGESALSSSETELQRAWGWGGPESLTPMSLEATYFYQVNGKSGPDSVRYAFRCE